MAWTKGDLVLGAYGELSIADDAGFEVTPGEQENALKRLDVMLATWAAKGIRVGYAFSEESTLNQDSGLADSVVETVLLNLARRLSPKVGRVLSPETVRGAREGYDTLLWGSAHPIEQQLPNTTPFGAGNKPWRTTNRNFMPTPDSDPLRYDDQSGELDILQE